MRIFAERSPVPTCDLRIFERAASISLTRRSSSRARSTSIAFSLFCSCDFWSCCDTTSPVGMCVMRTAESVVFTLCPPGPLERKTSMRRSLSSILTSTSSASGSTATVAAEVWMRPCVSVAGTRCTRCTPLSQRIAPKAPSPDDLEDRFLDAAERAVGVRDRLAAPAGALDVARVHAIEVGGEQRGLVAAGAGADLDDRVAVVERIVREERGLQPRLEIGDGPLEPLDLVSGLGGHLGVVNENELARFGELVLGLLELGRQLDDRLEASVLPTQLGDLGAVAEGVRVGEQPLDLRRPGECVAQQVAEAQRLSSPSLGRLGLVLLAEALDATSGVDQTLLAGVERVALGAHVRVDLGDRGARLERVAARALHAGGGVLGMDIGLH